MSTDGVPAHSNGPSYNAGQNSHLTIVKTQCSFLASTLTEENFNRNHSEILALTAQHGPDTYHHFLRRLIQSTSSAHPQSLPFKLLNVEANRLTRDPALCPLLRDTADGLATFELPAFLQKTQISNPVQKIIAATSFLGSTKENLVSQARTILGSAADLEPCLQALSSSPNEDFSSELSLVLFLKPLIISSQSSPTISTGPPHLLPRLILALGRNDHLVSALVSIISKSPPGQISKAALSEVLSSCSADRVVQAVFQYMGIVQGEGHEQDLLTLLLPCSSGAMSAILPQIPAPCSAPAIVRAMDIPHYVTSPPDGQALFALLSVFPDALPGLFGTWINASIQLHIISCLLSLSFSFATNRNSRMAISIDLVHPASSTIKSMAAAVQANIWNSLDLLNVLIRLTPTEDKASELLELCGRQSAEICLVGIATFQIQFGNLSPLVSALRKRLLALFLSGHPSHQLVFLRLWQIDRSFTRASFREYWEQNNLNVTRISDVAHDLKILEPLLSTPPFAFSLDMASLASRREYLNLEKWLADLVSTNGQSFLKACLDFLALKVRKEVSQRDNSPSEADTIVLQPQRIAAFLRVLRANTHLMKEEDLEQLKEVRNQCIQIHPRLMNLAPRADAEPGLSVASFTADIEAQVEQLYHRMYDKEISIDDVVRCLEAARDSEDSRQHELFAAMLNTLFEEYRWLHSYPEPQLSMTGIFFGELIQHRLIEFVPLGIAIRYVLDALRCPSDSNRFRFGTFALSRFQSRLGEWPQVCQALLDIPHLLEAHPQLAIDIPAALNSANDDLDSQSAVAFEEKSFPAVQIDQLSSADLTATQDPSEETSDRILFLINNLAPSNFDDKIRDMRNRYREIHARWLANYLVNNRISHEPNNHPLYISFLEGLAAKKLNQFILHETFVRIEQLLNSEATATTPSDRLLLKNLGSWLGGITLAKNKPILFRNIAFKELLVQGYDSGKLIVAIPFVCKVLEQASRSQIFLPPNPWLMAVLRLLVELYQFAELKLNLKFEIEVLCKALSIDLADIPPTSMLKSRNLQEVHSVRESLNGVETVSDQGKPGSSHGTEAMLSRLPNLQQYLVFNSSAPMFASNPQLRRIIHLATEQAIREIIAPVVERSVTIAALSSRELVQKDFAAEGDETKMRSSASDMVSYLAGNLALVTCKEPLRISMIQHTRSFLIQNGFTEQNVPEQAVYTVVQDNLDLACSVIEKAAQDKALPEVDESLSLGYQSRQKYRERMNGPYFESNNSSRLQLSSAANMLPEILRTKPGGLSAQQLAVYEEFGRMPHHPDALQNDGTYTPILDDKLSHQTTFGTIGQPGRQDLGLDVIGSNLFSAQQSLDRFSILLSSLDKAISLSPSASLSLLPPSHEIRSIIVDIPLLAAQSLGRDETALNFSQKIMQLLYKSDWIISREVYVLILEGLCEISEKAAKEVMAWLHVQNDERKFNVPVTVALMKARLIIPSELDLSLARTISRDFSVNVLDFTAKLIRECLFEETAFSNISNRANFHHSLDALAAAARAGKSTEAMTRLNNDLQIGFKGPGAMEKQEAQARSAIRDQLAYCFVEWVKIFGASTSPEKVFVPFITQLQDQGVLRGEDTSTLFFRTCVELSVDSYTKQRATSLTPTDTQYQPIDALSKLVVLMIKYHADPGGINHNAAKVTYLSKVLSIASLVMARSHEQSGDQFQQKPFFRLFSSLLSDLHGLEMQLGSAYYPLLLAVTNSLVNLQPSYFPGFAYSWLTLISHRLLMPTILSSDDREGWETYHRLLMSVLRFLGPFLRGAEMRETSRALYKGTMRIFLVLFHDFPDFLTEFYMSFCDTLPDSCVQLRNLILSAFPLSQRYYDPFSPSLNIQAMHEVSIIPSVSSNYTSILLSSGLRGGVDAFLQNSMGEHSSSFFSQVRDKLQVAAPSTGRTREKYDLPLINCLTMYVGVFTVAQTKAVTGNTSFNSSCAAVSFLIRLLTDLEPQGRYHLINAIVNQLRYPNAHSYFFHCALLHIFELEQDAITVEIITRVLTERLLVTRPHPWFTLATLSRLVQSLAWQRWSPIFHQRCPELRPILERVQNTLRA